jgi:ADP-ribose pyrophosphatase YjhB (NUDIX family)
MVTNNKATTQPEILTLEANMNEKEFLANYRVSDFDLLSLAVDTVIFGLDVELAKEPKKHLDIPQLKILLVKRNEHPFQGRWSLPGGFVGLTETLEETASRVIYQKTGLSDLYLEQLYTFGSPYRDPRARIVSCSYLALIDKTTLPHQNNLPEENVWFSLSLEKMGSELILDAPQMRLNISLVEEKRLMGRIPQTTWHIKAPTPLAFDHAEIILKALTRIRGKINYTDLAFSLMPEKFTLSHLMTIYEIILGEKLLSPAFRKKITKKISPTDEFLRHKKFRPSRLYIYVGTKNTTNGG